MTKSNTQLSAITNQFGDVFIDVVNQKHFSNNSALKIYENILKKNLKNPRTLYVVIGSDSGLFPKSVEKLDIPEGSAFLFIELDPLYPIMLSQLEGMTLHKCIVANQHDWEELFNQEGYEKYIYDEKVLILNSLAAEQGHIQDYIELKEKVTSRLRSIQWERLSTTNQEKFLEQQLLNAVDNIYPVKMLEGIAKGDALVLGAGPSLEKFIPWIQENQNKIYIIAASRLYQQLIDKNIKPDIIVSSDPFDINYHQSKAFLADHSIIFIHTNQVNFRLSAQWGELSFYRDKLFPWESKYNLDNFVNEGPTVTHCAVATAIEMGFENIYLAGVDLCYDDDGTTHSFTDKKLIIKDGKEKPQVKTYYGKNIFTDYNLQLGVANLTEIVQRKKGTVYNLNRHAAIVEGINYIKKPNLENEKFKEINLVKPSEKQRYDHLIRVKREIGKARLAYKAIFNLASEAIEINKNLYNKAGFSVANKQQIKLDKIEHTISNKFRNYTSIIQLISSSKLLKLLNSTRNNLSEQDQEQWLHKFYLAYQNGSQIILNLIDDTQVYLQQRISEYDHKIKSEKLISIWTKNDLIGRSCLLLNKKDSRKDTKTIETCKTFIKNISLNFSASKKFKRSLRLGREYNWDQAIKLMHEAYETEPELENGFAKLGWIYTKTQNWDKAWKIAKLDYDRNTLSAEWKLKISQLLARLDRFEDSLNLINQAYEEDNELKNGFAKLGWIHAESRNWEEAWNVARNDLQSDRLNSLWKVNIAQILGRLGDEKKASELILSAYSEDPELKNGFARLGWIHTESRNWEKAWEIAGQDLQLNRLNPIWKANIALLLGRLGNDRKASELIISAYSQDPYLKNGFARLGWIHTESRNWKEAWKIASNDFESDRLSPMWKVNFAILIGRLGDIQKASELITLAYSQDPELKNGFACLSQIYAEQRNIHDAIAVGKSDLETGRITPIWKINIALLYARLGKIDKAVNLIDQAYKADKCINNGYARLGLILYEKHDFLNAKYFIAKDIKNNRISFFWQARALNFITKLIQEDNIATFDIETQIDKDNINEDCNEFLLQYSNIKSNNEIFNSIVQHLKNPKHIPLCNQMLNDIISEFIY